MTPDAAEHDLRPLIWLAACALIFAVGCKPETPTPLPPAPATKPCTAPATTRAAEAPPPLRTFLDLVRREHPDFPATQPTDFTLQLQDAAHVALREAVYLDGRGHLWITRSDAEPDDVVATHARYPKDRRDPDQTNPTVHFTPHAPAFVQWRRENEKTRPILFCPTPAGGVEVIDGAKPVAFLNTASGYDWPRARQWFDQIIVPTHDGVSILSFTGNIVQETPAPPLLAKDQMGRPHGPPQYIVAASNDNRSLVFAWVGPDADAAGGRGAACFRDGKWTSLGIKEGWPDDILQVIPYPDGHITLIARGKAEGGDEEAPAPKPAKHKAQVNSEPTVKLVSTLLAVTPADDKAVLPLVDDLSNDDEDKRKAAFVQLAKMGPSIWPVLERELSNAASDEARARIRALLGEKANPRRLGLVMALQDDRLQLVGRLGDGGAVYYAPGGVEVQQLSGDPQLTAPAWLAIRPGPSVELLAASLVKDLDPNRCKLSVRGTEEWVVTRPFEGPEEWVGNTRQHLLPKRERAFGDFVGRDTDGRWVFRRTLTTPTTAPADAPDEIDATAQTLVVDPSLPSVIPRLPVWELNVGTEAGWDKDNWPVVKNNSAYAVGESGNRLLAADEPMFTQPGEGPTTTTAPTTAPTLTTWPTLTTQPTTEAVASTQATTTPTPAALLASYTQDYGPPLLTDPDGNRYFDGKAALRVLSREGKETTWPLVGGAAGTADANLVRTNDGRLFLFNAGGRVLRLRSTPNAPEPFALEATFTRKIPNTDHPTRVWLDPAGRIDIVYDQNKLSILFASGYVPPAIVRLMPADAEDTPD